MSELQSKVQTFPIESHPYLPYNDSQGYGMISKEAI
jgi:hypothetical protein